jgi:hypothetical protein
MVTELREHIRVPADQPLAERSERNNVALAPHYTAEGAAGAGDPVSPDIGPEAASTAQSTDQTGETRSEAAGKDEAEATVLSEEVPRANEERVANASGAAVAERTVQRVDNEETDVPDGAEAGNDRVTNSMPIENAPAVVVPDKDAGSRDEQPVPAEEDVEELPAAGGDDGGPLPPDEDKRGYGGHEDDDDDGSEEPSLEEGHAPTPVALEQPSERPPDVTGRKRDDGVREEWRGGNIVRMFEGRPVEDVALPEEDVEPESISLGTSQTAVVEAKADAADAAVSAQAPEALPKMTPATARDYVVGHLGEARGLLEWIRTNREPLRKAYLDAAVTAGTNPIRAERLWGLAMQRHELLISRQLLPTDLLNDASAVGWLARTASASGLGAPNVRMFTHALRICDAGKEKYTTG